MKLFFRQQEPVIGMKISASSIKLIELKRNRSGYELEAIASAPLPDGAVMENMVVDAQLVSQAIHQALKKTHSKTKNVALSVSGNAVIIKVIQVLTMTTFELESQIAFEAEHYLPFDISEVYLDFQILGETKDSPEYMDVALVACKRDLIDNYQQAMRDAGLTLKCVDCAVFALENALGETERRASTTLHMETHSSTEDDTVQALVNIGSHNININIMRNHQMAFVRDHFFGGTHFTEAIHQEHGITLSDAEHMKIHNLSAVSQPLLETCFDRLSSEISRSLDFYRANNADFPVQNILLSGGGSLLQGIDRAIEQRLGIATRIVDPFQGIKIEKHHFDATDLALLGPAMMIPVGLAMRGFDT